MLSLPLLFSLLACGSLNLWSSLSLLRSQQRGLCLPLAAARPCRLYLPQDLRVRSS
jgi:hypothetical protein